jgi:drug/metabolite transporter (DMT)-like permease
MKKRYFAPLILISANLFFTGSFSLVKYFSLNIPVYTIMLFRFLAGPIYLGPYFVVSKKSLKVTNWTFFCLRVGFGVAAMMCLFLAFKYSQLAKSLLIFELSVLWTLLYGWIRLGNRPHLFSLLVIPIAFIGILFVLQPNGLFSFQLGDGFAFLGSILNAGVYISIKELRNDHDTSTVVLVSYVISALILLIPNLIYIPQLSAAQLVGLCLMSSIGFVGQMGMTLGFKFATAGISSLLMLSIIPLTSMSGMLFFGESLNLLAWIGISLVVLALAIIGRWQ